MFALFYLLSFLVTMAYSDSQSPCGNWISYQDEKCYVILDTMTTETEAEKLCKAKDNTSNLLVIHKQDEQDFIMQQFKKQNLVNEVWIGLKQINKSLKWVDNTDLDYTNWLKKPSTEMCTEMSLAKNSYGKWDDQPCNKKNLVVCQKLQHWTIVEMQKSFLEDRRKMNEKVITLETNVQSLKSKVKSLDENPVPIGFIYAQLPDEPEPINLWPSLKWSDISSDYSGLFFRVLGGDSEKFNVIQSDNSPRVTKVTNDISDETPVGNSIMNTPGQWSDEKLYTGSITGSNIYLSFYTSSGEVRPRNKAIKIWKRIK